MCLKHNLAPRDPARHGELDIGGRVCHIGSLHDEGPRLHAHLHPARQAARTRPASSKRDYVKEVSRLKPRLAGCMAAQDLLKGHAYTAGGKRRICLGKRARIKHAAPLPRRQGCAREQLVSQARQQILLAG